MKEGVVSSGVRCQPSPEIKCIYTVYIRCGPLPVTVTTVTGRGPHPKYTCKLNIKKASFDLQLAAVVLWELFSRRQRYVFNF